MLIPEKYRTILILPLYLFLSGSFIYFFILKKDSWQNTYDCKTKGLEVKGVITMMSGQGHPVGQVAIDNLKKAISLNIDKEISKIGFPENYTYSVGDSVIKKAGSKEFIVKRDGNVAVYLLDCDD